MVECIYDVISSGMSMFCTEYLMKPFGGRHTLGKATAVNHVLGIEAASWIGKRKHDIGITDI